MAKLWTANKTWQGNTTPVAGTKYLVGASGGKCNYQTFNENAISDTKRILQSTGEGVVSYSDFTYADLMYNLQNNIQRVFIYKDLGYFQLTGLSDISISQTDTYLRYQANVNSFRMQQQTIDTCRLEFDPLTNIGDEAVKYLSDNLFESFSRFQATIEYDSGWGSFTINNDFLAAHPTGTFYGVEITRTGTNPTNDNQSYKNNSLVLNLYFRDIMEE